METFSIYNEAYYLANEDEILDKSRCGNASLILSYGEKDYPCIKGSPTGSEYKWMKRLEDFSSEAKFRGYIRRNIDSLLTKLNKGRINRLIAVSDTFYIIQELILELENKNLAKENREARLKQRLKIWIWKTRIAKSNNKELKAILRGKIAAAKVKIEALKGDQ